MSNDAKLLIAQAKAARRRKAGVFFKPKKNKIKNWYTTRQLITAVNNAFEIQDGRVHINGKWNLQIRGKHMRRLKKKMKIKQVGRWIVRDET